MAWPADRRALIHTLKLEDQLRVLDVRLLGHTGILPWSQTSHGRQIDLPAVRPAEPVYAFAIRLKK